MIQFRVLELEHILRNKWINYIHSVNKHLKIWYTLCSKLRYAQMRPLLSSETNKLNLCVLNCSLLPCSQPLGVNEALLYCKEPFNTSLAPSRDKKYQLRIIDFYAGNSFSGLLNIFNNQYFCRISFQSFITAFFMEALI